MAATPSSGTEMAGSLRRLTGPAACGLILVLGAAAGLAASHRAHGLDPFSGLVLGMAASAVAMAALVALEPAWILTGGLMLSVFSGNWGNIGIPIPLDRVAIFAGLIAVIVRSLRPGAERIRVRNVHWLMLVLLLYAVASAAWSGTLFHHGPLFALLDRLGLLPFLFFLVAPVAFRTEHQRRILAVGLLALGAYLGLLALFEKVGPHGLVIPHYISDASLGTNQGRGRGPFLEAGANGLAMFECLVAAAITLPWWSDRRMRAVTVAVIVLCVMGIIFTLTRQTWAGAVTGTIVAMLASRRLRLWLPSVLAGSAAVLAISLLLIPGLGASLSHRANDQAPIWDRLNSDAAALRMVAARPALGFGWGEFGAKSVPYYRLAATYPLTSVGDAHNVPLSNASELGLAGLALWLVILVMGLGRAAVKRQETELEPWRLGLIAIAVAWFVQANFTPFDYAFDNYVPWLWAGLLAAGATRLGSQNSHQT